MKPSAQPIRAEPLPVVVILTALSLEWRAVVAHLVECTEELDDKGTVYECGTFAAPDAGQSWRVVVVECGPGNHLAADFVHFADARYHPLALLFVGVAGSVKKDVRLGDVVASTKVYFYHGGKADVTFSARPVLEWADQGLEQRARATARKDGWRTRIKLPSPLVTISPDAHVGAIAAGEQVVAATASPSFEVIQLHYSDSLAVEMEGYGALAAARRLGIPGIVVRGISDNIKDKAKRDGEGWQPVAAAHASAFAFEMLANYRPRGFAMAGGQAHSVGPTAAPPLLPSPRESSEWCLLKLNGTIDAITPEHLAQMQEALRTLTGDLSLTVERTDPGSILLTLRGSPQGLARLAELHRTGQLREVAGFEVEDVTPRLTGDLISTVLAKFATASRPLLEWETTLPTGTWLERPELRQTQERCIQEPSSTTVILGKPGSGKSALLARLGQALRGAELAVLAIKADLLPPGIKTLADLTTFLELPAPVADCVRCLAMKGKVAVLIDQLDALADLVDLHSGRLNVLLDFIDQVAERDNVHVVCSCRDFEFQHDRRLASVEADVVRLSLPDWEQVAAILKDREIEPAGFPDDVRELLRTPQYLKLFLRRTATAQQAQPAKNYQLLLDELWEEQVLKPDGGPARSKFLMKLAQDMSEAECLWLPAARYEAWREVIDDLIARGILTRLPDRPQVGFQHQTLFEHARARAFAHGTADLAAHVLARQDGLFIRPTLWHTLLYLRSADPLRYERDITRLWEEPALRRHVRYLLIEFLAQVEHPAPSDQEEAWLAGALKTPGLAERVLRAIRGRKVWFDRFSDVHFPALMRQEDETAFAMSGVLEQAWPIARPKCLGLIEQNWLPDPAKHNITWHVLRTLPEWDERALAIPCAIVRRKEVNNGAVAYLATLVSEHAPELAPQLVGTALEAAVARLEAQPDPEPPPLPPEADEVQQAVQALTFRSKDRFRKLLEDQQGWHDLPVIARAAPEAFVRCVWPPVAHVVEAVLGREPSVVLAYRDDLLLASYINFVGDETGRYALYAALDDAVRGYARTNPNGFLEFLRQQQASPSALVQRLLCRGLCVLAPSHPAEGLAYLRADSRRFYLGNSEVPHADSKALVTALAPHLTGEQRLLLEQAILDWQYYSRQACEEDGPEKQAQRQQYERGHRLQLLRALPAEHRSEQVQELIGGEAAALPDYVQEPPGPIRGGFIGSPMSPEQMALASDEELIALFDLLVDSTEHRHPHDWMQGGSSQASQAFGEFAKAHPDRACRLMERLRPNDQQRPVAFGLRGLAQARYAREKCFSLVLRLDERGFGGEDYRETTAGTLGDFAEEGQGLPDEICALLERWRVAPWTRHESPSLDRPSRGESPPQSVLWQPDRLMFFTGGCWNVLRALTLGYLMKKPPAADRWLAMLEDHLGQPERPATWAAFSHYLRHLGLTNPAGATRFIERLFAGYPGVRDSAAGAVLVPQLWHFLPVEVAHSQLSAIRESAWADAPLAYGELLALRHFRFRDDPWASDRVNEALDAAVPTAERTSQVRMGMAYAAAHGWDQLQFRGQVARLLLRLIPLADANVAHAVMEVFVLADGLMADEATRKVLTAIRAHPLLLHARGAEFLADLLVALLPSEPELVCGLAEQLVRLRGKDLASFQSRLTMSTPPLIEIALRLQRLGEPYRLRGLTLFEDLLERGVGEAQAALLQLDKRREQDAVSLPRRRRRDRRPENR